MLPYSIQLFINMNSNMSGKEEELLKNGFQSIMQAFELQGMNFTRDKEKYELFISSLQSENEQLKEENEKLKADNIVLNQEGNQLRAKIDSLLSSLQTKQDKMQQIKQSIEEDGHTPYHLPSTKKLFNFYSAYTSSITPDQHNTSFNYNTSSANNSLSSKRAIDLSYRKDKFNSIQERINNLKVHSTIPIPKKQYKQIELFDSNSNTQSCNSYRPDNSHSYREGVYKGKSQQYELTTKFLDECKLVLSPKSFNSITALFKEYREGRKDDKEVSIEVKKLLSDNSRLLHLFDVIFRSD